MNRGFKQASLLEAGLPGAAFVAQAFMPGRKTTTSQTTSRDPTAAAAPTPPCARCRPGRRSRSPGPWLRRHRRGPGSAGAPPAIRCSWARTRGVGPSPRRISRPSEINRAPAAWKSACGPSLSIRTSSPAATDQPLDAAQRRGALRTFSPPCRGPRRRRVDHVPGEGGGVASTVKLTGAIGAAVAAEVDRHRAGRVDAAAPWARGGAQARLLAVDQRAPAHGSHLLIRRDHREARAGAGEERLPNPDLRPAERHGAARRVRVRTFGGHRDLACRGRIAVEAGAAAGGHPPPETGGGQRLRPPLRAGDAQGPLDLGAAFRRRGRPRRCTTQPPAPAARRRPDWRRPPRRRRRARGPPAPAGASRADPAGRTRRLRCPSPAPPAPWRLGLTSASPP